MPPHHPLLSRGTNATGTSNSNLSDGAIIVIVLVAAGFAVLVGFSITRFYFDKDKPDDTRPLGDEQMQYMHSVRQRNLEGLGFGRKTKEMYSVNTSRVSDADDSDGHGY